jgi:glycosyltransferase involved in cell wall biosynthesis
VNRAVITELDRIGEHPLPPPVGDGRLRVLFLHSTALGHATYGRLLERYAAESPDLDAVHVHYVPSRRLRAASHGFRRLQGYDFAGARRMLLWRLALARKLFAAVPLTRFDVVHAATQPLGFAAAGAARRAGVPIVVNVDCTSASYAALRGGAPPDERVVARFERRVFESAALVVAWSHWAAGSLRDDSGLDPDRVQVVPPTVPLRPFERAVPAEGGRPLRIGFVGNEWERKGGSELLRWHQERWSNRAELHVASRGARPDDTALNVVWHGALSHDDVTSRFLPTLDVFVLPTKHEVFGLAVLEAAGAGVPVVTSRMAAMPELVADGRTGFLCEPGDERCFVTAVERLLSDPAQRASMGGAARRHVEERFNPEWSYPRLFALLRDVADGRRPTVARRSAETAPPSAPGADST